MSKKKSDSFIIRLNEACDYAKIAPYNKGRIGELARILGISERGTIKYFHGDSKPTRKGYGVGVW